MKSYDNIYIYIYTISFKSVLFSSCDKDEPMTLCAKFEIKILKDNCYQGYISR